MFTIEQLKNPDKSQLDAYIFKILHIIQLVRGQTLIIRDIDYNINSIIDFAVCDNNQLIRIDYGISKGEFPRISDWIPARFLTMSLIDIAEFKRKVSQLTGLTGLNREEIESKYSRRKDIISKLTKQQIEDLDLLPKE